MTDGFPDCKNSFENELINTAKNFKIFLTINLCVDDDAIVNYYNDLDKKIGAEVNNFDVIDDYESEAKEVYEGNKWINYSYDLHVARMAGCNNFIADLIDEGAFAPHFCSVFTN